MRTATVSFLHVASPVISLDCLFSVKTFAFHMPSVPFVDKPQILLFPSSIAHLSQICLHRKICTTFQPSFQDGPRKLVSVQVSHELESSHFEQTASTQFTNQ